jgi:hypothetical protein
LITKEVALNFADEVAKAQSFPMILARQTLFKSVRNGDSDKALKFLEKRDKRYQPSMKIG